MAKRTFKCPKCDRSFALPLHLGRHMSTTHASPQQKAAAKRKRRTKQAQKARSPRATKRRAAKPVGRPKGIASRLGLRALGLDELAGLIDAARVEARRKLADIRGSLG